MKWCVCIVEYYFDREQDESRYRAIEVLTVHNSEEDAQTTEELMRIVDNSRNLAVIKSTELLDSHR